MDFSMTQSEQKQSPFKIIKQLQNEYISNKTGPFVDINDCSSDNGFHN